MEPREIFDKLKARFPEQVLEMPEVVNGESWISVAADALREVCETLQADAELEFDYLMCLSGVDLPPDQLCVVYHLYSNSRRHRIVLKVFLSRDDPKVPSISKCWPTANWHEREAYDMFGIVFRRHPNLRRILLPPDWVGHPLRKDYVFPTEYRGIKCHD